MKKIFATLSLLAAMTFAFSVNADAKAPKNKKTETVSFAVNLHCENCVNKVKENISFEKGVKGLEVVLDQHRVTVTYDPAKTSGEKLVTAIEKLGYKVEGVYDPNAPVKKCEGCEEGCTENHEHEGHNHEGHNHEVHNHNHEGHNHKK